MAITEGRGGMPSLKSGQRVEGFSKVEPAILARMLDGQEERRVVGREDRAAHFRAGRRLVEAARRARGRARRVGAVDAVGDARRLGAPSVAIQMRPLLSKAMLSGQLSQPLSEVARW